MTERERLSLRAWREEIEREEWAEREERERPIREAAGKLLQTQQQLAGVLRERLLDIKDPDVFVDPKVGAGVRMTEEQAAAFNAAEWKTFVQGHPEFFASEPNVAALGAYLERNGLRLVTAAMLERLVQRFADLGLLEERPIPEPPEPEHTEVEEPQTPQPIVGLDLETGLEREYTRWEVERLSADDFKRIFRPPSLSTILANRPHR